MKKKMTLPEIRCKMIFNEWAERYAENPEDFGEILDDDGVPIEDYGETAMRYFFKIASEMDNAGKLPSSKVKKNSILDAQ